MKKKKAYRRNFWPHAGINCSVYGTPFTLEFSDVILGSFDAHLA